jgi:hypothetical protein
MPEIDTAPPNPRCYTLIGPDGLPYPSLTPGVLGGHRGRRIYGRLDCCSALRAIRRGGYVDDRVFFADVSDAVAAGYRPCAVCMPDSYKAWQHRAPSGRTRT